MTKNDIKPGMVVEFRDGVRAFVVKVEDFTHREKIIFMKPNGFVSLNSYNENLVISCPKLEKLDIMKIYDIDQRYGLGLKEILSDEAIFKLLWQREETIEISLEDISKKFNVPISQIRIKG